MIRASSPLRRLGRRAHVLAAIVAGTVLVVGGLVPSASAQGPDRSDVVIVLDFSASILRDKTTRNRFGAALERIANRVDETSADLVAGDATVSIVQFAARAADTPGCVDLKLLNSPASVGHFADCLRVVAAAYRRGQTTALTKGIGVDTNYVAAMTAAARHLPANSPRPAMILFTDGKHEVKGVPVGQVQPARDRLFGNRSPFALLPVGMGLDPKQRRPLAAGLERLRITKDMPACVSGSTFEWPNVVFQTADEAGNAVAVALQDATCTFTVAPTPTPTPAPTPAPVRGILLTPGDSRIDIVWSRPATTEKVPVIDYMARCGTGDGNWIQSTEGVSTERKATVSGLTNGVAYTCEVAAIGPTNSGAFSPAVGTVTPIGVPAPPAKPAVEALNQAIQISAQVAPAGVDNINYECSADNGTSWPVKSAVDPSEPAVIGKLTNGVTYVCRAFAANAIGVSAASPLSDGVRPCSSSLECNTLLLPIIVGLVGVLVIGILAALYALFRSRTTGYVVAVVDIVHTANIGHGSTLGIAMVRGPDGRTVTGIVADRGRTADVRIRRLRGERFAVRDRTGRKEVGDGEQTVIVDRRGVRHSLLLRAFATNAASEVAARR